LGLFCRRRSAGEFAAAREGRWIGGRATQQTRSYFALKLPHNWWLWGVDCQIKGYVDQPQIDFFDHVAKKWMQPKSRLILCTGMPNWQYVDVSNPGKQFRTFSYLERIAGNANRGHRLRLVLSGDSHHYSRYVEGNLNYITAGGGGAFLHPTHYLTDKIFEWSYPPPGIRFTRGKTTHENSNLRLAVSHSRPISHSLSSKFCICIFELVLCAYARMHMRLRRMDSRCERKSYT
jgi:hypothetical protein